VVAIASLGSEEAYFEWLGERSIQALPRIKLAEAVAEAARKRMRGEPKEAVENVVRRAVRDVYFLSRLVIDINTLVSERTTVFDGQAALCARGLQLLVVAAAVPRRGQTALPWPSPWSRNTHPCARADRSTVVKTPPNWASPLTP